MKIIIVGMAYPYRGGLAAFNERLSQEYVKNGHDVEVFYFHAFCQMHGRIFII
ncbi:MAG: hypothetical protein MJZ57_09535 [Bacteroidales bacterium]|nr:hypothetical protein [Bacteroidales bacterium]